MSLDALADDPHHPFLDRSWSIENRTAAADYAYHELLREAGYLQEHTLWSILLNEVVTLEARAKALEGEYSAQDFDDCESQLHETGSSGGWGVDFIDRYFPRLEVLYMIEDLAIAFVLTLHARIAAVHNALARIYTKACKEDKICVRERLHYDTTRAPNERWCFTPVVEARRSADLWSLGNFIKHRDEWPRAHDDLTDRQQQAFRTMKKLGAVSVDDEGDIELVPRPVTFACSKLGKSHLASANLQALLQHCERYTNRARDSARSDFLAQHDALCAVRAENARSQLRLLAEDEDARE
ncbi:MAG: hypothetical protein RL385_5056 [Pseudomonadota bacterium]|jgi:hypothetical protein